MQKNNLRKIREKRNLNQRELAEACHTPQSLISDVERGQKATWPKLTARLCQVLNVTPKDIFPHLNAKKETGETSLAADSPVSAYNEEVNPRG